MVRNRLSDCGKDSGSRCLDPVKKCAGSEGSREVNNAKCVATPTALEQREGDHEQQLREEALDQIAKGWLDGPFPHGEDGKLPTEGGPAASVPCFEIRSELRAEDGLSQTNRASDAPPL